MKGHHECFHISHFLLYQYRETVVYVHFFLWGIKYYFGSKPR